MKKEYQEIFTLKTLLWKLRLDKVKKKISQNWTISDVDKVIKTLKRNQTTDPNGMINEVFLPDSMGSNLKAGLVNLMNGIKGNLYFPDQVLMADIASIFKNRGSRLDLSNDHGIFILAVVRKIFDKLIYQEKYPFIDGAMSDSNIGARKKRSI